MRSSKQLPILLLFAPLALIPSTASPQTSRDGLGVALPIGQAGNLRYGSTVAMTVVLEKVDSPLVAVQWNNRVDMAQSSNSGYSSGNGGEISVRVREVKSISGGKLTLGDLLGETARVANPVLPASWNAHWRHEGGNGTASTMFRNYPTLRFKSPIDLRAAGLEVGDLLAFEFVQHNPKSGTVSINVAHADAWKYRTPRAFSETFAQYRVFGHGGTERREKMATILFGYQDGDVKGNPWYGLANSKFGDQLDLNGTNRIRQVIPIKVSGKSVKKIHAMVLRTTFNAANSLIIELWQAGSKPGAPADEGRLLYKGSGSASSITKGTDLKHHKGEIKAVSVTLPSPIKLTSGKTYYVVAKSAARNTTYRIQKMQRVLNQAQFGLKRPDFMHSGFRGQQNTGSGWSDMRGGTGGRPQIDAPLWIEF